ncbi:MAG: hypothetical protein ACKO38_06625 [Planctomycetota bacterium]
MMESARQNLVGFVLNALDHAETIQVEEALAANENLRDELQRIRAHLSMLDHDRQFHEPPPGLAVRTCHWLANHMEESPATFGDSSSLPGDWAFSAAPVSAPYDVAPLSSSAAVPDLSSAIRSNASVSTRTVDFGAFSGNWSAGRFRLADLLVAASVLIGASFLFVPALSHCRFASQTQACQNNLKQVGVALMSYSDHHGGFFPPVPGHGNRAFAGVIGVMLRDSEFLASPAALFCAAANRRRSVAVAQYPTLAEIDRASAKLLPAIRQAARGDYGFSVGYWDHGKLALLRNQHRPWYALAADAPSDSLPSHATANHAGRGQSVLFEDGHYQFLRRCCPRMSRDELFLNHLGHVSPGVDANDSVILAGDVPLDGLEP